MTAPLLRRAAAKLRETDKAAFVEMTTCPGGYATTDYRRYLLDVLGETEPRTPVLEFAVMMAPEVAVALAALLEAEAGRWDAVDVAGAVRPGPEALTVACRILGEPEPPYPPRRSTPPRPGRNGGTTHTAKRVCNGCGEEIGDANTDELAAAIAGRPLPDVRDECPRCSQNGGEG